MSGAAKNRYNNRDSTYLDLWIRPRVLLVCSRLALSALRYCCCSSVRYVSAAGKKYCILIDWSYVPFQHSCLINYTFGL